MKPEILKKSNRQDIMKRFAKFTKKKGWSNMLLFHYLKHFPMYKTLIYIQPLVINSGQAKFTIKSLYTKEILVHVKTVNYCPNS